MDKKNKISYKTLYIKEKKKNEDLERKIEELNKKIEEKDIEIELLKKPKGYKCSVNGKKYEKEIHNIVKNCSINGKIFNTQKEEELGGCSNKNDINCNFISKEDIGIEIKKSNTPDWMQCSIKYDVTTHTWKTSKGRNTSKCSDIFTKIINNLNLYNGDIPPFFQKLITHEEWINIKKETTKWNDKYFNVPSDTIRKLYQAKGCKYLQISNGYGLYHLGTDTCGFDVPLFDIEQQLRIRTKIHTKKNKKGYCNLSITISCKPINIKNLTPSNYSLDDKYKLPKCLIYNSNQ